MYPPRLGFGDRRVRRSKYDDIPSAPHGSSTPRKPRVAITATLLSLALASVAADRIAAAQTEARTAEAFQKGMNTRLVPEVHVRGFPVLTQMASGTLRNVDITAHDIPASGTTRPLPVTTLSLRLDGLRRSDDESEVWARSADATAFLSYEDLSTTLGLGVSQGAHPGQIRADVLVPFGGEVAVTTMISAAPGNRIAFGDFEVAGGTLPTAGRTLLDKVFEEPIQLQNVPKGLELRSVTSAEDGLSAHFTGHSVTFRPENGSQSEAMQDTASYRDA